MTLLIEPERTLSLHPDKPLSIWMPARLQTSIPDTYQGTPLEIVRKMADDMKPGLGVDDAIDMIVNSLVESLDRKDVDKTVLQNLHGFFSEEKERATVFVMSLLLMGVAQRVPDA